MTVSPEPAQTERRIGRYVITGRIGRGGMGMVWRGYDPGLQREVAVKTLSIEATLEEEHLKRFEVEARAAARLQHPNIVTIFELGDDRGVPYIAMELLAGADLDMLLRAGDPLLLQEKLDIMIQVCRGLHYAHERQVVHRDIKPSNIRVLEDGTAKIMDFGIAKLAGSGLTKSGMLVGTVHCMSPEQVLGRPLDGRSDLFSVGVILFELFTGRRPFAGESMTEVLYKIVHDSPPLPEELANLAEGLPDVVTRALAKDPEQRPATAGQLADELGRILSGHLLLAQTTVSPEALETVNMSRRLLEEGRVEESVQRLRQVTERYPQSLQARRALRWATREIARRDAKPAGPEQFAELDAKFFSAPTRREPEMPKTVQETRFVPSGTIPPLRPMNRIALTAAAVLGLGLLVAVITLVIVRRTPAGRPSAGAAVTETAGTGARPASERDPGTDRGPATQGGRGAERAPGIEGARGAVSTDAAAPPPSVSGTSASGTSIETAVALSSEPPGAAVTLDGKPLPGLTPLTVHLNPRIDHRLVVSREGYVPQEIRWPAGRVPPEASVSLARAAPPGTVEIASSYPVAVTWRGRTLAREQQTAQVSLPSGVQTLTLVAPAYFLNVSIPVEVREGEVVRLQTPALGKLHIRAQPDNCRVFIDGAFVDYPPILDRPVAVGRHTVSFQWPDGKRSEQAVDVTERSPAYVTGRKE